MTRPEAVEQTVVIRGVHMTVPDPLPSRDDEVTFVQCVADSVAAPVIVISADGRVLACNTAARTALRSLPFDVADLNQRLRVTGLAEAVERVGRTGETVQLDWHRTARTVTDAPSGRPRSVGRVSLTRLRLPGGRDDAVTLTIERATSSCDLADLEAANALMSASLATASDQLQAVNEGRPELERVQQADEQKNTFLAMLAHELRGPLAPIASALHIIRRRAGGVSGIVHALDIADRQVHHQARLLDDLLDISRIVHGKVEPRREAVDLSTVARAAADALDMVVQTRAHQLRLDLPDEPVVVIGDATRLEQIVRNLLGNAVKYTDIGGRIDLCVERRTTEAVITVRDNGTGITREMLPRVFDLFAQGDASLARSQGGLGIGLTLVARLAELHGGTVAADSPGPGHGSTFTVTLPRVPTAVAPAPTERPAPIARSRRILVVEDNRDARVLLRVVLELEGHVVEEASDGVSAVRMAVEWAPDIVVLDIGLPGLNGYEVGRRIRNRLGRAVRLVALTGYGDSEARDRSDEAGFDAHLVKPVEPDRLARVVTTL